MKKMLSLMGLLGFVAVANAENGMKTVASQHDFPTTQARLESRVKEKGLIQFAKIDHAEGARKVGLAMLPATVTIFGHPKGGTPFMVAAPLAAIDFPLKALVWQNAEGQVFVSYVPVATLVSRHAITGQDELTKKLDGLLDAIARAATE